jgi:hypothetical protein
MLTTGDDGARDTGGREEVGEERDTDECGFGGVVPRDDDPDDSDDNCELWGGGGDDEHEPTFHPQAAAQWGDHRAMVDVEMAPLVTELWRAGIETYSSCQDLGESLGDLALRLPHMAAHVRTLDGRAALDLSPPDAQPVLDMVAAAGPLGSVYDRMTRWTAEGAWKYGLLMLDLPDDDGSYSFRILGIQLVFPRRDIPALTQALRRHNARLDEARRAVECR